MAEKDRSYDPLTDYDSESEREERERYTMCNVDDDNQDMNNIKVFSFPYLESNVERFVLNDTESFVLNDTSEVDGGWRRGGPLMIQPPNNQQAPLKVCINCNEPTAVWHKGERFECDEWYADDPEELDAHNQLCTECATDEEKCPGCPVHPNAYYKNNVDTNVIPEVVPD